MNYLFIVWATVREAWVRKTAFVLAALAAIALLFYAFGIDVRNSDDPDMVYFLLLGAVNPLDEGFDPEIPEASTQRRVPRDAVVFFSATLALGLLNPLGLFFALFVVITLFNAALKPKRLYWVLAKPVHRVGLLLSKYAGGLLLVLFTGTGFISAMVALIAWKTGVFFPELWLSGLLVMFNFAILAAFALLMIVWTGGTGPSLILTGLIYLSASYLQALPGFGYYQSLPEWSRLLLDGAYHILPKISDVEILAQQQISGFLPAQVLPQMRSEDAALFASSAAFLVATLAIGAWEFQRRDI